MAETYLSTPLPSVSDSKMDVLRDLLALRCPVCRKAPIFRGLYAMNETCPSCGVRHVREPGYFLGALIFAYVMGAFLMVPTIVVLVLFYEVELPTLILVPTLQTLLFHPFLFVYSRTTWMYLDRNANPKGWS